MKLPHFILILFFIFTTISCNSIEPRRPISAKSKTFLKESVERNKEIYQKEEKEILKLIEKDTVNVYHTSKDGFWYYYKKKDSLESTTPKFGDKVMFTYTISDLNGKALYSIQDLGEQAYIIDKEELFSGLREGLKLMKSGEEVTFIFPSQKAFGFIGDNKRIGINVPLVCNVALKSIEPQ
ncbi:MAG: gliding motility-associated peptidyl-prolyl isomerase GldI [Flavobacteriaceae bacterium]|nr:gliding motility-associated peptidyl-prolyl isomerase GldI [Flavobacteriaceae bacterium]